MPPLLAEDGLVVEPLTLALLDLDTAAYLASPRAVTAHSGGRWPVTLTAEENRELVAGHVAEHEAREAFAYALLTADRSREVGCAYLRPLAPFLARSGGTLPGVPDDAAILTFWLVDADGPGAQRPSTEAALAVLRRWVAAWGAAPVVLRCLPEETEHVEAAQSAGLQDVDGPNDPLPYRWFVVTSPR